MSYGYGGRQNPFDDRGDAPQQSYGGNQYGNNQYNDYNNNVEMTSMGQQSYGGGGGGYGAPASDPNAILNECRSIDQGIDQAQSNIDQLRSLQNRFLSQADTSENSNTKRQLEAMSAETMDLYRGLVERVRTMKGKPEASSPKNNPQVDRVDRRLKGLIQSYQAVESQYRKKTQDQMARQYRIVRPDADENEVRQAVSDPEGGAVFSQALMNSNRQGQARAVLSAVQDRHREIQRIERQMVELAQMFQDMNTVVVQQEAAVAQIEQKGEEVAENLVKGNEEIETAVNTARSTRKKKWWCLAICVAIIIVVAIIVVVVIAVNGGFANNNNGGGGNNNAKRAIEAVVDRNGARAAIDRIIERGNAMGADPLSRSLRHRHASQWAPGANAAGDAQAANFARLQDVPALRF